MGNHNGTRYTFFYELFFTLHYYPHFTYMNRTRTFLFFFLIISFEVSLNELKNWLKCYSAGITYKGNCNKYAKFSP